MRHKRYSKRSLKRKDHFIDLAQEAFEEADKEEEKKGVIGEVMEALIVKTGAPLMAEVISEQFKSQEIIEKRAAEMHERKTPSPDCLKEPVDEKLERIGLTDEDGHRLISLAEYSWRLFRLLMLASLVGLICQFLNLHKKIPFYYY
ncbi:hypothetical protein G6F46_012990 [Rhizopus delemar]|uniref:Uncharacterized protein n=3 Tax=Rhizopus TaxID=4842 RepID=I1CPG2_RHIO9|nr:hypothetical protein RO3G_15053 [Rhizopus delemar RA 99-880]KAG1442453.1 hypothetical protein G6F55_012961 [Rhizopus delemar]KAG1534485.1 hypothetical protein G6F51_012071 [Rhizopus arrhizus]KAG1492143.1 hypothetical protein G6F53_012980 [Rhizopus delemar]KAG1499380.1 hypothetical protein G6F52_012662 [Rhizopus delemar]|eukprot:EIE90342.1 hypothetical protein RO3G_15053 [Rhizopus delemar RA 99-880]